MAVAFSTQNALMYVLLLKNPLYLFCYSSGFPLHLSPLLPSMGEKHKAAIVLVGSFCLWKPAWRLWLTGWGEGTLASEQRQRQLDVGGLPCTCTTFCIKVTSCIRKTEGRRLLVPPSLQKLCLQLWGLRNGTRSFSSSPNSTILRHGAKGPRHGHTCLMGPENSSGSVTQDLSHCGVGLHSFPCASWINQQLLWKSSYCIFPDKPYMGSRFVCAQCRSLLPT